VPDSKSLSRRMSKVQLILSSWKTENENPEKILKSPFPLFKNTSRTFWWQEVLNWSLQNGVCPGGTGLFPEVL
jgi:hypothetical protein